MPMKIISHRPLYSDCTEVFGRILADALGHETLNVAESQSYEPTSRGGLSRADLVASNAEVDYPLASDLDYLESVLPCRLVLRRPVISPDFLNRMYFLKLWSVVHP